MHLRNVILAAIALSTAAFAQPNATLDTPFQVRYAANLNIGESYIDITNTGANGAPLLGPGFGGASGNICANVYAFDPGEELISCCSCLITPDQTVNLGGKRRSHGEDPDWCGSDLGDSENTGYPGRNWR
jgi:hypothetical protein